MNIQYLGFVDYGKGTENNAYLINLGAEYKKWIIEITIDKKVVLFGCGTNSYIAENMLKECGVNIYGYADNSSKLIGRTIRGKKVYSIDELLDDEKIYFIITTQEFNIFAVRLQFMVNKIDKYSIFAIMEGNSFYGTDVDMHNVLIEGINCICCKDKEDNLALPQCAYSSFDEGKALYPVSLVVRVTSWSHYVYQWTREFLKEGHKNSSMLEIGQGDGLFTYVMSKLNPEIKIEWLIFGEDSSIDYIFDKSSQNVIDALGDKLSWKYGLIEYRDVLDKNYKLIVLTEVFEHFALNPVETMTYLAEHLEDDGRIMLTTPNWGHQGPYRSWKELPNKDDITKERYYQLLSLGHVYQYDRNELEEIFMLAGLEVERYSESDRRNHNYCLKKKKLFDVGRV